MKKILFALLPFLTSTILISQNFKIGFNYGADVPFKSQMPNMSTNHSAGFALLYKPVKNSPIWFAFDFSAGCFASRTVNQEYMFTDGSTTKTDVNYSSNMTKCLLGAQIDLGKRDNLILPYLKAQGGFARTGARIFIEDPSDPDGCKALENKLTFSNANLIYSVGGGIQLNINKLNQRNSPLQQYIDFGINYIGGNEAKYVNIKYMKDHVHGINTLGSAASSSHNEHNSDTREITATFINVSSNNTHEHKVAEVYTSPFKMINIRLGYVLTF